MRSASTNQVAGVLAGMLFLLGLISTFWSLSHPAQVFAVQPQEAAQRLLFLPGE